MPVRRRVLALQNWNRPSDCNRYTHLPTTLRSANAHINAKTKGMRRHVRNISLFYKLIRTVKKRPPSAIKWRIQYQNCHCGYIKYLFTIFKSIFYLKLQKEIVQIANYSQTQTLQRYISNGSFRSFMLLKPQGFCLKYGFLNNLFQRSSNISHVLRQVMNFVGAM